MLLLVPSGPAGAADEPAPSFEIVKVADGVHAALQPQTLRFNDSNSTILINDREVIVIDTQAKPSTAEKLIRQIRKMTKKPVRFVINTHWHGDHTLGNQAYRDAYPDVVFVAHDTVLEDIVVRAVPQMKEEIVHYEAAIADAEDRLGRGVDLEGQPLDDPGKTGLAEKIEGARRHVANLQSIEEVLPTLTFERELTLYSGDREIRLIHYEGHTRGDLVVHLPQERVLISGDLLDELPFGGHGYVSSWIDALDRIEALEFDTIVPGHGPVFKGKDQLTAVRDLIRTVNNHVKLGVASDLSYETILTSLDVTTLRIRLAGSDALADRIFDSFVPTLMKQAFDQAHASIGRRDRVGRRAGAPDSPSPEPAP